MFVEPLIQVVIQLPCWGDRTRSTFMVILRIISQENCIVWIAVISSWSLVHPHEISNNSKTSGGNQIFSNTMSLTYDSLIVWSQTCKIWDWIFENIFSVGIPMHFRETRHPAFGSPYAWIGWRMPKGTFFVGSRGDMGPTVLGCPETDGSARIKWDLKKTFGSCFFTP